MSSKLFMAVVGLSVTQVAAHGILGEFFTDGVRNAGFQTDFIYRKQNGNPVPAIAAWSTESTDRGYIEPNNMQTLDINCHVNAEPGALTAQVTAGGQVDFFWPDWPHNVGPVLTYMAPCGGDCSLADKSSLKWVKIDEAGYNNGWAGQKLMDHNNTWTITVPTTFAPGNYVFRNEIINLHSGAEPNGAQLYPQCVNIEVTGSGTEVPDGVLGVDLYKADDAGILFDPYADIVDYPIPGPALYTPGDASSSGENTFQQTTQSSLPPLTTAAPTTIQEGHSSSSVVLSTVSTTLRTRTRSRRPVARPTMLYRPGRQEE